MTISQPESSPGQANSAETLPPLTELERHLKPLLHPAQNENELGRLGGYRIFKLLGAGGMGAVFLAEDEQLQRQVAMKVMLPWLGNNATLRERFLREARAMAALRSPHIIQIFQVGEDQHIPFLSMELLQGQNLSDWLKQHPEPTFKESIRIGREIAQGLADAHEQGVIHRDIKPGNIWLEFPKDQVKILDFGLAFAGNQQGELTDSGTIIGTPSYLSPEQAEGKKADERSDLFSLGCILYRLTTGVVPFGGETVAARIGTLLTTTPAAVRQLNPDVPEPLDALIMKLIQKNPSKRLSSAVEVVQQLESIEQHLPETMPAPLPKVGNQSRHWWTMIVSLALIIVFVLAFILIQQSQQTDSDVENNPAFSETWLTKVNKLSGKAKLDEVRMRMRELNPDFDDWQDFKLENERVVELRFSSKSVSNISPLIAFKDELEKLYCSSRDGEGSLKDLSPLKEFQALKELDISHTGVNDLTPLAHLHQLKILFINNTWVTALTPLKGLKLTHLRCGGCELDNEDLKPLRGMPILLLDIESTNVTSLDVVNGMSSLYALYCERTTISNLSPLKGLPLHYLYCANTNVKELSPLKGMPLRELTCDLQLPRDLPVLRSLENLVSVNDKPIAQILK